MGHSFEMLLLFGAAASAPATANPPSPWASLISQDVAAYCADIRGIHPGMVDPLHPAFAKHVNDACAAAASRAQSAASYLDWRETMEALVASFRDGHTNIRFAVEPSQVRWPGFLIDGQGGHWVVRRPAVDPVAPADSPPEGAMFLGCDGQSAEAFLKGRVDNKTVDWSKLPERTRQAYKAFITPQLDGAPAKVCRFEGEGKITQVTLDWRTIPLLQLQPHFAVYFRRGETQPPNAADFAADGHVWIRLGDVQNETTLKALESKLQANQARFRAAPYVVFDLRGNAGGSSMWGGRFASIFWGEETVEARRLADQSSNPNDNGKYWRRSKATGAKLVEEGNKFAARGPDFVEVAQFFRALGTEIAAAAATKGDGLLQDECCQFQQRKPASIPKAEYMGKAFVLTDAGCFSSCVVVMNTLKRMGAIQVGEASGQNEVWGESVGPIDLPSGLGSYRTSVSIIRQPRSALGGLPPDIAWPGAMDDDDGLRKWIAELASRTAKS